MTEEEVLELTPTKMEPLVLRALEDLGGEAHRQAIVRRAVDIGGFSAKEVAVPRKYKTERPLPGHLHTICYYAVWYLKTQGLIHAPVRGEYEFTDAGRVAVQHLRSRGDFK